MDIVVVLDNIRSLHNVGSIFRTSDAAGVKKIYLCGVTPEPFDKLGRERSDLVKVSLGAEKYIHWEKISTTVRAINKLKKEGYLICAIEQSKDSIPYYKLDSCFRRNDKNGSRNDNLKIALILGEEVKGMSKSLLKKADKILEIPMYGKKESLNVSVAYGIVIYGIMYKS